MGRCSVNEIVPGLVYQRGQIFTWPREQKKELLERYKIKWIVNFWPKAMDPDLSDVGLRGYLHIPLPDSALVLEPHVVDLALHLTTQIRPDSTCLVLCEAGKTRSVFFSALLLRHFQNLTGPEALQNICQLVPSECLKVNMRMWLKNRLLTASGERQGVNV
jgi:hypothetical protein